MTQQPVVNPGLGMRLTLSGIRQRFPKVENISTNELHLMMLDQNQARNVLLLDVRAKEERQISFIKSSVFVDAGKPLLENVDEVKQVIQEKMNSFATKPGSSTDSSTQELLVVAYCSIGYRSSALINGLHSNLEATSSGCGTESTLQKVKLCNLEGSIFKWANEKRPMVNHNDKETTFVHPYNNLWGKLLEEAYRKWN